MYSICKGRMNALQESFHIKEKYMFKPDFFPYQGKIHV